MILTSAAVEADIHREVYVAMLRAALRQRGDKTLFAQQTGVVTREFLSYVTGKTRQRDLSPRTASVLASHLSWPPEVREKFVEHVNLGQQARLRRQEAVKHTLDNSEAADLLTRLQLEFATMLSSDKPEMAKQHYRAVRDLCLDLLHSGHPSVHPRQSPLNYVDICLWLCSTQGVLNRPDEALFFSKLAAGLLQERDWHDARTERARHNTLHVAAMGAEASAYYIMGLPQLSFDISSQALDALPQGVFDSNMVHLIITKISALAKGRRFSIREARSLGSEALKAVEKFSTEREYQHQHSNIDRALAAAETRHGNAYQALSLLQPLVEQSEVQPGVNLIRQASLLRSYAQAQFNVGDSPGGMATLRATLKLALEAGLTHQIQQNRITFGANANVILEELAGEYSSS